jgi:D-sedoheptulose 7-phosphate isomerase
MQTHIESAIDEAIRAMHFLKSPQSLGFIERAAEAISDCFSNGGKLLIAGNGGSLCDAMHFAEELTAYFRTKRKAFPAIALSDVGHMSCTANDVGYEKVFSRAIEALGKPGDLFVGLTTSGNSQNIIEAVKTAKELGVQTMAFLGKDGGKLKGQCDLEWVVEGFTYTDRIQEAHMAAIHIIIEMVEKKLLV